EGSSLVQPGPDASWGAKLMLEEGLFDEIKPDAIFALHVMPGPSGQISWRTGATTAASDMLNISVTGSQGHGGMPWNTIDPIVTSAQRSEEHTSELQSPTRRSSDLGAKLMLEEGLFDEIKPDAIFALHVMPGPSGQISWRTGATTAASDMLNISVTGSQGHGGMPWNTIDPIVTSAQVINGVQTVVSRK